MGRWPGAIIFFLREMTQIRVEARGLSEFLQNGVNGRIHKF